MRNRSPFRGFRGKTGFRCALGVRIAFTFCIDQKVTMVRPANAQPCATAHQPTLVALKTRFTILQALCFSGCCLACPYFTRTSFRLYGLKEAFLAVQTISCHRLLPIRNVFFFSRLEQFSATSWLPIRSDLNIKAFGQGPVA
jgi:hypothetical protein